MGAQKHDPWGDDEPTLVGRDDEAIRAVHEALDAVAAPAVRDRIVRSALLRAGLGIIPTGESLADFVSGPLRFTISERIDLATADSVVSDLMPVIRMIATRTSSVRRRVEDPRTVPPSLDPRQSIVVVATADAEAFEELVERIGDVAQVERVKHVYGLLQAAELHAGRHPRLVIDCRAPELGARVLGSLGRLIEPATRVVLWGLRADQDSGLRWPGWDELDTARAGAECSADDLALLIGVSTDGAASSTAVLLLHKDDDVRAALESGLRDAGLEVEGVASPADALASCTRRMPGVVVTAYRAKGMSGAKVARAIHLVHEDEAPPVILLLGPDDVATGDLSAVRCVAAQSLAPDRLADLVRELLPP
jgi:CheY-like chemotaxis protein